MVYDGNSCEEKGNVRVYDLEQELPEKPVSSSDGHSSKLSICRDEGGRGGATRVSSGASPDSSTAITCNSSPMIREKLNSKHYPVTFCPLTFYPFRFQ